ncbi:MAG: hypothetical protein QGH15_19870 [Kiritimatiellia bacterium]|jgi:hypothetical protein|nr:hypothetical protein [Kiritimatiellia bacterium]
MFRTVTSLILLVALAVVMTGCATSMDMIGGKQLACIDPGKEKELKSPEDDVEATLTIENKTQSPIKLQWLDYDGARVHYQNIAAGREAVQLTYVGHYWIILDAKDKPVGIYETTQADALIVIK